MLELGDGNFFTGLGPGLPLIDLLRQLADSAGRDKSGDGEPIKRGSP
jgi:hypothetical protein